MQTIRQILCASTYSQELLELETDPWSAWKRIRVRAHVSAQSRTTATASGCEPIQTRARARTHARTQAAASTSQKQNAPLNSTRWCVVLKCSFRWYLCERPNGRADEWTNEAPPQGKLTTTAATDSQHVYSTHVRAPCNTSSPTTDQRHRNARTYVHTYHRWTIRCSRA